MMPKFYKLFILMALLGMPGCREAPKQKRSPPYVTVSTIKQQNVPIYFDAIGQAIPTVTVQIRPQVAGKLVETFIQQGSIVEQGQVIYKIDPRPYQAILEQAKAQLEHDKALLSYADKTVERYKSVVADDFIPVLTYEQYVSNAEAARAQIELDKAAVNAAQINVDFCDIVAPVSGKISYFVVDVGNILAVDDPTAITAIRPFSPIDIEFSLSQQQFEKLRNIQESSGEWKFIASLPEDPDHTFEGTTFFVDNQINQDTGTILLKGRLPNVHKELWPGEFVKVKVLYQLACNALVVPPGAILMGKNGAYLYILDAEGKAFARNVTVLVRENTYIAFTSAELHKGDTVIIDGQINVAEGILVHATEQKAKLTSQSLSLR